MHENLTCAYAIITANHLNTSFTLRYCLRDVRHSLVVSDDITDTNRETVVEQPIVHDCLQTSEQRPRHLGSLLTEDNVHKTAYKRADRILIDNPP